MLKIILNGYLGSMGQTIRAIADKSQSFEIVAGIDALPPTAAMPFPTFVNIDDCDMPADVIIDFSTAAAVSKLADYAAVRGVPVVICTTGLPGAALDRLNAASGRVAVFHSANMSIGVNLLAALVKKAAAFLDESGFDIEIIEKHHNRKLDAPSGTALLLADAVNGALKGRLSYVCGHNAKRGSDELGIHSLRGGTIVGEHAVVFAGTDEVIEFTHTAQSREVFANGAISAAKFLKGKPPGLYNMDDLMQSI